MTAETEAIARALQDHDPGHTWISGKSARCNVPVHKLHAAFVVEGAVCLLEPSEAGPTLQQRAALLVTSRKEELLSAALRALQVGNGFDC